MLDVYNYVELIVNDLIKCCYSFEIQYIILFSFGCILFVECYLTHNGRLVDRLLISMNG